MRLKTDSCPDSKGVDPSFHSVNRIKGSLDLNCELIHHKSATSCICASGNSMKDCGIDDGDLLVIDKALVPQDGDIVVAFINGEFTLKTLRFDDIEKCIWLVPANYEYSPIKITEENDFLICGVLTYNIKRQLRKVIL